MKAEKTPPIEYEDLILPQGYSVSEESLWLFTEEENSFRREVRAFLDQEIVPMTQQFEKDNIYRHNVMCMFFAQGVCVFVFWLLVKEAV